VVTYLIGLTGSIATGKSLVLAHLRERGAYTIDADKLAHECMAPGSPAHGEIARRFGRGVLAPGEEIDRAALGRLVFSDAQALADLEAIVHPHVVEEVSRRLAESGARVAVVEAIKLLEANLASRCHAVWVTTSAPERQIERLTRERGLSRDEAVLRLRAQPPSAAKVARADVLLENDGSLALLEALVDAEWEDITAGRAPGMGTWPSEPELIGGVWRVAEAGTWAAAAPAPGGFWRLSVSLPSRAPRLWRPLLPAMEAAALRVVPPRLRLLVPALTGYRQFLTGKGYAECEDGAGEPGHAAFSRDL
jgi:dephospho-CoA kinase